MSQIKSKGSKIERLLSEELRRNNIRFNNNYMDAIGKPDIAIPKIKLAIFCDSSFWHGYKNMTTSRHNFKSNKGFWVHKIQQNIKRDKIVNRELKRKGWTVIRLWDHQILKDINKCIQKIQNAIKSK